MTLQESALNDLRAKISRLNNVRALVELNPRIRITPAVQGLFYVDPHDKLLEWVTLLLDDEDSPLDNAMTIYFVVTVGPSGKSSAKSWIEDDRGVCSASITCGDVDTPIPTVALRCVFEGNEQDGFWHVSIAKDDLTQCTPQRLTS